VTGGRVLPIRESNNRRQRSDTPFSIQRRIAADRVISRSAAHLSTRVTSSRDTRIARTGSRPVAGLPRFLGNTFFLDLDIFLVIPTARTHPRGEALFPRLENVRRNFSRSSSPLGSMVPRRCCAALNRMVVLSPPTGHGRRAPVRQTDARTGALFLARDGRLWRRRLGDVARQHQRRRGNSRKYSGGRAEGSMSKGHRADLRTSNDSLRSVMAPRGDRGAWPLGLARSRSVQNSNSKPSPTNAGMRGRDRQD